MNAFLWQRVDDIALAAIFMVSSNYFKCLLSLPKGYFDAGQVYGQIALYDEICHQGGNATLNNESVQAYTNDPTIGLIIFGVIMAGYSTLSSFVVMKGQGLKFIKKYKMPLSEFYIASSVGDQNWRILGSEPSEDITRVENELGRFGRIVKRVFFTLPLLIVMVFYGMQSYFFASSKPLEWFHLKKNRLAAGLFLVVGLVFTVFGVEAKYVPALCMLHDMWYMCLKFLQNNLKFACGVIPYIDMWNYRKNNRGVISDHLKFISLGLTSTFLIVGRFYYIIQIFPWFKAEWDATVPVIFLAFYAGYFNLITRVVKIFDVQSGVPWCDMSNKLIIEPMRNHLKAWGNPDNMKAGCRELQLGLFTCCRAESPKIADLYNSQAYRCVLYLSYAVGLALFVMSVAVDIIMMITSNAFMVLGWRWGDYYKEGVTCEEVQRGFILTAAVVLPIQYYIAYPYEYRPVLEHGTVIKTWDSIAFSFLFILSLEPLFRLGRGLKSSIEHCVSTLSPQRTASERTALLAYNNPGYSLDGVSTGFET